MSEGNTNKPVVETSGTEGARTEGAGTDAAGTDAAGTDAAGTDAVGSGAAATDSFRGLLGGLMPRLAFFVAVIAILIAGSLWWQYRQFYVDLHDEDESLRLNLEDTRASLRLLDDQLRSLEGALEGDLGARDAEIARLADDIALLPAELRALGRRVEALQGGRVDARASWLREQARYYLVLANSELTLGRRVRSAIEALELADDVLRELAEPGLTAVRTAIAAELQQLRSVDLPDLEGLSAGLASLIDRVPDLPMRASGPDNFGADEQELEDVEPGLGRLWASTRGAMRSIVRVERQDEPVGQLLTESERRIARRQLALELQIARTAVLDGREEDFRASLIVADGILQRDFESEAQSIIEARRMLAGMSGIELAPRLPDISDSLTLLGSAPGSE